MMLERAMSSKSLQHAVLSDLDLPFASRKKQNGGAQGLGATALD